MEQKIRTADIQIPASVVDGWQDTVDLIANLANIPASLIMRVHRAEIEVFISSHSDNNPYQRHDTESLGKGLYCETVLERRKELLVPNALEDPDWDHNPDIELGMIAYCGLPLYWPDNTAFGTICILDSAANAYNDREREILARFQQGIEASLATLYHKTELEQLNQSLETQINERTTELKKLNKQLTQEIDNRTSAEWMLHHQRHYDAQTGLPNRAQLNYKFAELSAANTDNTAIAALDIRLNDLQSFTDNLGYKVSEGIVCSVAHLLQKQLSNNAFLARLSDDEFVVLLYAEQPMADQTADLAGRFCQAFRTALQAAGQHINVSVSIGIAFSPDDAADLDTLLHKASSARAFNHIPFGNCYQFFNGEMQQQLTSRLRIQSKLSQALEREEFSLHFQPQINTQDGSIIGAEALLRWHNDELGDVPPQRFISIAEQNGQIIEIGYFVMRQAIEKATRWHRLMPGRFHIAVNLSPLQFREPSLADTILSLLDEYELPAQSLQIEVTERVLMQDEDQALDILSTLTEHGVRVSLDDFGTGYSSLSYLQRFPFDSIKIDGNFISNLTESRHDQELVRAIIAMANNLNLKVVAEGVETAQQAEFIRQQHCHYGQGYHYGRPDSAASLSQRLLLSAMAAQTQVSG